MSHSPTPTELLALRTANAALLKSPDASYDIVATVVFALGSAQLLQSPETAMELELLQRELAAARAELEGLRALKPAPIQTCRTCGAGYTYGQPCGQCEFEARMADERALRRIEADRPEADITHRCGIPLTRRLDCGHCPHEVCETCDRCPHSCQCAAPQQPVEDPHDSPLHHEYALGHDLPAPADLPESLR